MPASKRVEYVEGPMILCALDSSQRAWLATLTPEQLAVYHGLDPWDKVSWLLPHRRYRPRSEPAPKAKPKAKRKV